VESEYYKEVQALDLKYQTRYDEINKKRADVISGAYEPSGEEIIWNEPSAEENGDAEVVTNGVSKIDLGMDENTKGIPKFWMHALKNANEESLMGLVEPTDEPALEFLTDITVKLNEPVNNGFTLNFHFAENPYFTNSILSKEYIMREEPNKDAPFEFDGPEIINCKGCKIDWKEGKDLTQTKIKKKDNEIETESFFSFFSPPFVPVGGEEEMNDKDRATIVIDFDVGYAIKEKVIPRAVLYFTGEAVEDDDDFEDCDTDEEDTEDEEDH